MGLFPLQGFRRVLQAALRHVLQVRHEPGHVRADHDAATDATDSNTADYQRPNAATADLHAPVHAE